MKIFLNFLILAIIFAMGMAQKYGASCTHTGDQDQDDAACVGNLLCGAGATCVCPDVYGISNIPYTPAPDGSACFSPSENPFSLH